MNKKSIFKRSANNYLTHPKNQRGITLIALVITIIVLIILAGVAINLALGKNGILSKVETAKLKYEIGKAEEELDIKIDELQVQKQGSATLQDVVDMLKIEEDMDYIVSLTEIATITGVEDIGDASEIYVVYKIYQFRVDNQLQTEFISIVENYAADVTISSTLKSHDGKNEDEKYLATFEIKVESEGQVESIEIETVDGIVTEVPTSLPYTKEIQVEIGQKYIVKVTTPDGKYKRYVIEEKAEETIKTAAELAAFRDKVNSGLTYEGKTVTLANDIDLSSVCGTDVNGQEVSWEPIGTTEYFKGIFEGNEHKIYNLYIKSGSYQYLGLFSKSMGIIQNLIMENIYVCNSRSITSANTYTGGIVGIISKGTITNCAIESGSVLGITTTSASGKYYWTMVGGVVGRAISSAQIKDCYNKAKVQSKTGTGSTSCATAGGICGQLYQSTVINCYNTGAIYAYSHDSAISGVVGYSENSTTIYNYIRNSYNIGSVSGYGSRRNRSAGIVSKNGWDSTSNTTITNCYCLNNVSYSYYYNSAKTSTTGRVNATTLQGYASTLGDAFIADGKIKNESGEWVDNLDAEGNIIYINNGYPILKWQIGE